MKKRFILSLGLLLSLTLTACNNNNTKDISQQGENISGAQTYAEAGSGAHLVQFPEYEKGIMYTTIDRGNIHEELWVNTKEAIEAAQNGEEFPSGTVITLVGYKNGELEHFLVMEKRTGWGSQYSPEVRNGEWEYQHFTPAREVAKDDIGRCLACHANQERDDYINTLNRMKSFDLGKVAGWNNSSTGTQTASVRTEDWEIYEISPHYEESSLIGNEEKAEMMQGAILTMYLQQHISQ